jgi:GNAT superfamily N-acetyltransferase
MVRLVPMSAEEFRDFIARKPIQIAETQVRLGIWQPDEASELARAELAEWIPEGLNTPDHHFCILKDEATGDKLGELWYCLRPRGRRKQLFVCWIAVDEMHRRRGHATAVLHEMILEANRLGAYLVALGVDGDNLPALSLYTKLGFVPKNIFMAKPVAP